MASIPFASHPLSLECVVLAFENDRLHVLINDNEHKAYKGKPALPSASVRENDVPDKSVKRTLSDFPGVKINSIEKGEFFADPDRFPKGRVISLSVVALAHPRSVASELPRTARWVPADKPGQLALDHKELIKNAILRIREKSVFQPVLFDLLPEKFTLSQLQSLYENMYEKTLDKRNFRKKMLALKVLAPSREYQKEVAHKAARYYTVDRKKFNAFIGNGGIFIF